MSPSVRDSHDVLKWPITWVSTISFQRGLVHCTSIFQSRVFLCSLTLRFEPLAAASCQVALGTCPSFNKISWRKFDASWLQQCFASSGFCSFSSYQRQNGFAWHFTYLFFLIYTSIYHKFRHNESLHLRSFTFYKIKAYLHGVFCLSILLSGTVGVAISVTIPEPTVRPTFTDWECSTLFQRHWVNQLSVDGHVIVPGSAGSSTQIQSSVVRK